jgi:hypothetical protein
METRANATKWKKMRPVHNLREFGTKAKKKEEPASHGSELGPKRFCHTEAAMGQFIGQVIR